VNELGWLTPPVRRRRMQMQVDQVFEEDACRERSGRLEVRAGLRGPDPI
jgi:hypothetical protein